MKEIKKPETREERARTFRAPKSAEPTKYVTRVYTYASGPNCRVTAPKVADTENSSAT